MGLAPLMHKALNSTARFLSHNAASVVLLGAVEKEISAFLELGPLPRNLTDAAGGLNAREPGFQFLPLHPPQDRRG
jgi:hypothetical protein